LDFLAAGAVSENFEIPENSVYTEVYLTAYDQRLRQGSQFDDSYPEDDPNYTGPPKDFLKISGSQTFRFFDNHIYDRTLFEKDAEHADSIFVRISNKAQIELKDLILILDQERPVDPDSPESRNQVKRNTYEFGELDINGYTDYVHTELLFEIARSVRFEARNQKEIIHHYDFEGYAYANEQELSPGYYTLEVQYERARITADRRIYNDENVEN